MKKAMTFISMFCILNVLVFAGLLGFLVESGRLDKSKVQSISDMLKHPGTPKDLRENVNDFWKPVSATQPATASAPATKPAPQGDEAGLPATAKERIDYLQRQLEENRLRLANEAQDVQHRQELLDAKQSQLVLEQQKLAEDKKVFEAQMAAAKSGDHDAGFQKALALFEGLKPKQVKDLLMGMQVTDAAKYVSAMDADRAGKIIAEFKNGDEKTFIGNVVDQVRGARKTSGTGAATAPAAAAAPAESAELAGARAPAGP